MRHAKVRRVDCSMEDLQPTGSLFIGAPLLGILSSFADFPHMSQPYLDPFNVPYEWTLLSVYWKSKRHPVECMSSRMQSDSCEYSICMIRCGSQVQYSSLAKNQTVACYLVSASSSERVMLAEAHYSCRHHQSQSSTHGGKHGTMPDWPVFAAL